MVNLMSAVVVARQAIYKQKKNRKLNEVPVVCKKGTSLMIDSCS